MKSNTGKIRVKIGKYVTWEKIGDLKPHFYYDDTVNIKHLNDINEIIVNSIIEHTIKNIDNSTLISISSIIKENNLANDDTEKENINRNFRRLVSNNKEWDVFVSGYGRCGGYRINDYSILSIADENEVNNTETKKSTEDSVDLSLRNLTLSSDDKRNINADYGSPRTKADDSLFISEFPPDGTKCITGEAFKKTWIIMNAGNVVWHNRYMRCDTLPLHLTVTPQVVKMPDVAPGEEFSLNVTYKADEEGSYYSVWRIYDEKGNKSFPHKSGVFVTLIVESDSAHRFESNHGFATTILEDSDKGIDILNDDISYCADLVGCSQPSIDNAIKCSLKSANSIEIDYNFNTRTAEQWPNFISAVFVFFDDVDLYKYCSSDKDLRLHFEIDNAKNAINGLQIELQTDSNRVVGNPYVIAVDSFNSVDIPISYYVYNNELAVRRRNIRGLRCIQNLCFVIKKEHINESKGSLIIRNIGFG